MPPRKSTRPRTRRPKKKANPKNLKKTTARGAYKKRAKKNMMKRRNPFVENKIRNYREFSNSLDPVRDLTLALNFPDPTDFEALPVDDAYTIFLPVPFYHMNRGLNNNEMIGNNIFVKYLKSKLQFLAPSGANLIDYPSNLYLIHGWITQPFAATDNTVPSIANTTYPNLLSHITAYLKEYFDERKDTLEFPRKREQHIKFLGYRKILTDKNKNIPVQGGGAGMSSNSTFGAIAPINMSCKWDIMKKVHYEKGTSNANLGNPVTYPMAEFNYPNTSWLPFVCVYNPQFASTPGYPSPSASDLWRVAENSQMWYQDS